jgi:hypothetical protein
MRDHELIKSEYSMDLPDGRKINYHGLGVRLPWQWIFPNPSWSGLSNGEQPYEKYHDACGTKVSEMMMWGKIDGQWHDRFASVKIKQNQDFTWYVYKNFFPYLACGPSNEDELQVRKGECFEENYKIEVSQYTPV